MIPIPPPVRADMDFSSSKRWRRRRLTAVALLGVRAALVLLFMHQCLAAFRKWSNPKLAVVERHEAVPDPFMQPQVVTKGQRERRDFRRLTAGEKLKFETFWIQLLLKKSSLSSFFR